MIQPKMVEPRSYVSVTLAPASASKRAARVRRRNYRGLIQIVAGFLAAGAPIMIYLGLMAHLTALDYKYIRANAERSTLVEETQRLDERLARLQSRERLASVAHRLGMRDPQGGEIVVVLPPAPAESPAAPRRVAFFGALADWLRLP